MARQELFGKETVAGAREVRNAAKEIQKIMNSIDMSKMSKPMQQIAKSSRDVSKELAKSEKYNKSDVKRGKEQSKAALLAVKYAKAQTKVGKTFRSMQISMLKGSDEFTKGLQASAGEFSHMIDKAKEVGEQLQSGIEGVNDSLGGMDDLFGGIGETIGEMVMNPMVMIVALAAQFNKQQEQIADEFGAMGVTEFRDDLAEASQEFVGLTLSAEEALSTIKELSAEFGLSVSAAKELSLNVADLSKSTGLSVENSTTLLGLFTETQGMTGEMAEDLLKSAEGLAVANDLAPNIVLQDVAENTELFAKFATDGGRNILKAAIQARKLGISLDSVGNTAESLLDFQSSLNAEVNASIVLGRTLNLQKAREAALNNDMVGMQQEILKQVGGASRFNKMNAYQRQALADAVGMELTDLQKVVNKQKEQKTIAGELSRINTDKMVPDEAITATAEMLANFQEIGMQLAEVFGPTILGVVEAFSTIVGWMLEMKFILPVIIGFMIAYKTLSIAVAVANLFSTAASTFKDIPIVGIFLGIAAAVAAIGTLMAFVGDIDSPADGKTRVHTKEGGLFQISKNDDLLAGPGLSAAMANRGGGNVINNVNTAGIEKGNKEIRGEMKSLREEMKSYFGFGGSAAKQIGSTVGSKFNQARRA